MDLLQAASRSWKLERGLRSGSSGLTSAFVSKGLMIFTFFADRQGRDRLVSMRLGRAGGSVRPVRIKVNQVVASRTS
jgi:hypothetical protein